MFVALLGLFASAVMTPLSDADRARATVIIESMVRNPRGPYRGIAWFCADGKVLAPRPGACSAHGGGHQYGVLSKDARELASYGIYVGTVLTALKTEDLVRRDYDRARALVVERYLERELNGWVLRRARSYRGARQAEDEEMAAAQLLLALSRDDELVRKHRPLLLRLIRALPYGGDGMLTGRIRALSAEVGDADRRFQRIRAKIHGSPGPEDLVLTKRFRKRASGRLRPKLDELIKALEKNYSKVTRLRALEAQVKRIGDPEVRRQARTVAEAPHGPEKVLATAELLERLSACLDRPDLPRLAVLSLMSLSEEQLLPSAQVIEKAKLTRTESLALVAAFARIAESLGLLSDRERGALNDAIATARQPTLGRYARGIRRLGRSLEWIRARYIQDLGAPYVRYGLVEPETSRIIDDLMRGGFALPFSRTLDRLREDLEVELNLGNRIVGLDERFWMRGENPGWATATLRVLRTGVDPQGLRPTDVVILEELAPALPPVAGILTLGQPGSLSHVSLLARNLGIPHVAISDSGAQALQAWVGQKVVFGVSAEGRVLIGLASALSPEEQRLAGLSSVQRADTFRIDETRLKLGDSRIRSVSELNENDAGVLVGPKAAELARLKRLFPGRVSAAMVLPFGSFLKHVNRPGTDGTPSPFAQLRAVYKTHPPGSPKREAKVLEALERFRGAIMTLEFAEGFVSEVKAALNRLGSPNSFGVFVRSDTNVEDLEEFTGAGLNLTVPNRVGLNSVLHAIRRVWASPFRERSYRWRQRLLENPEHVYPSVLLHRTVPSQISGVLVTTDLQGEAEDAVTISVSEGVGAVVDGGSAETIVVEKGGRIRLLSSSRIFAKKIVPPPPAEGVVRVPASGEDPLLTRSRLTEVRALLSRVLEQLPNPNGGVAWDIEFGLLDGKAWLFQLRPLRESKFASTHPLLAELDRVTPPYGRQLNLNQALRR